MHPASHLAWGRTHWLLQQMRMRPQIWIDQVFRVVSDGGVAGRVEGLHALQLREVALWEVLKLHRVGVRVGVVVPVF